MKKYYIAANILGAIEVRADSPEQAQEKASKLLSKRFTLQPKPTGLWVFEKPPTEQPDEGSGAGA
jgi:hypothetical protein